MAPMHQALIRDELVDRRRRLEEAMVTLPQADQLRELMSEVDLVLSRLDAGTYGLCETCGDPVEPERLAGDPLLRHCLDHLTPRERRALEQDLQLTWRIQSTLLPERELRAGSWEATSHYEPAGPASGDCCDVVPLDDGELFFLLGDVSGKGLAASMLMSHLQAIFRSLVSLRLPLQEMVERANRLFCESVGTGSGRYATIACGRAHGSGRVDLCNAGHCPPLQVRGGELASVAPTGLPLGLFGSSPYEVSTLDLGPGGGLLIYTDGLTESTNRGGEEYGADRVAGVLRAHASRPGREIVKACLDDVGAFRGNAAQADDLTVLFLRHLAA